MSDNVPAVVPLPAPNVYTPNGHHRGVVPGLGVPRRLIETMPAVYQEDFFAERFTGGLDECLAPIISTLDCLWAYIDPYLTPSDFLDWLASWVAMVLDETWPEDRRRATLAHAVELYLMRGTIAGLAAEVQIFTGGQVEINESGGCVWSATPGGEFPGEPVPRLAVRVILEKNAKVNEKHVDAIVAAAKPAHVVHAIEIVKGK
jgi:phage tail-like protein